MGMTTTNVLLVGPATSDGKMFGSSPSDPISFFGDTPTTQQVGAAQAALARGVGSGSIATMATSQSPAGPGPTTSIQAGLTGYVGAGAGTGMTWQIATTDFVIATKPTAQAGLGYGNVRASATNQAGVTFTNYTAATITPTAGEKWGIVALRGLTTLTAVLTPAAVAASTTAEQIFNVTGARVGAVVAVNKPSAQATLDIVGARIPAANQIGITFANVSATTPVTPTAGETYAFWQTDGVDAVQNVILYEANFGTIGQVSAGTTSASTGVTLTGLATSDAVIGISKPTGQAGVALGGAFVSAANLLGVTIVNSAASVTATANEVYAVTVHRPNPVAPVVMYTQALTPVGIAPNTTAEQLFTVTGLPALSVAIVNKPSAQAGMGIGGVRVSAANQLGITFVNATAATITPTAGEVYAIANLQVPIPDAGNGVIHTVPQQVAIQNPLLTNALRNALAIDTGMGLIAGV